MNDRKSNLELSVYKFRQTIVECPEFRLLDGQAFREEVSQ